MSERTSAQKGNKVLLKASGLDPASSAGLFVGVRDYLDPNVAPVQFAVDDAVDLAMLFCFDLNLIHPSNVHLAISGEPVKSGSQKALAKLVEAGAIRSRATLFELYRNVYAVGQKTEKKGIYIVSFAGHGFNDQGASLFCPEDSLRRRFFHTGLNLAAARDDIDGAKADRRLVLVDACRGRMTTNRASMEEGPPANTEFLEAFASVRGLATLFATSRGGHSYDDTVRQNGVFTRLVIDGLSGDAAESGRPFITLEILTHYVHSRIRDWIRINRHEQVDSSRGVHLSCEAAEMMKLPLAVNLDSLEKLAKLKERIRMAIGRLKGDIEDPLTGQDLDKIRARFDRSSDDSFAAELLAEIEQLDGSVTRRRAFAFFVGKYKQEFGPATMNPEPAPEPSSVQSSRLPVGKKRVEKLGWASDAGEDEFGRWATLAIGSAVQRMRWIAPGKFSMGSPDSEPGRSGHEGPRHDVDVPEGFWLADTPCTQKLWIAVMKGNKSRFRSILRPVDGVAWNDTQAFLARLSTKFPKVELGLPSEAQWEYSCRAGTGTETYVGNLQVVGINNAPLLDEIAWYAGNSGCQFELSDGEDVSHWPEKQYPAVLAGTRTVGEKRANSWGLFDMLGNVWEWCQDEWQDRYCSGEEPGDGVLRTIRGGSWASNPNEVRSASRYWRTSSDKDKRFDLGFRFVLIDSAV